MPLSDDSYEVPPEQMPPMTFRKCRNCGGPLAGIHICPESTSDVERLRALVRQGLGYSVDPDESDRVMAEFEAAVRAEEREAIAASCEAQAAVCATSARAGVYRHCARMARDVTARVGGRGGGA